MGACACIGGYFGVSCEENDSCVEMDGSPVHCENGGYCENSDNDQFVCICAPGFVGVHCKYEDLCYGLDCGSGECHFGICVCDEGFTGEGCDEAISTDPCEPNPCKFQGTCVNDETTGSGCSVVVGVRSLSGCEPNPCHSGSCIEDDSIALGFYCSCPSGFEGDWCEHMVVVEASESSGNSTEPTESMGGGSSGVYMPPTCDQYPSGEDRNVTLTMRSISDMGRQLKSNLMDLGPCYQLIKTRMFGRLGFSRDLVRDGPALMNWLDNLEDDASAAESFASLFSSTFKEAFGECDDGACVVEILCQIFTPDLFSESVAVSLTDQLQGFCLDEAWRFSDFMADQILEGKCDFTFVPVAFAQENCSV